MSMMKSIFLVGAVLLAVGQAEAKLSLWVDFKTNFGWSTQVVGDFNGDGRDDIASFHPAKGQWWVGLSNGSSF